MLFRDYLPTDQAALIALFGDFQDYIVSLDPQKRARRLSEYGAAYLAKILKKVTENRGKFIVAEHDGKIVGIAVGIIKENEGEDLLEEFPSTYGELLELYLDEQHRSQGLGSQLMKLIEEYFEQQHCDSIFIDVFAPNKNARAFYAKHGYDERELIVYKKIEKRAA